jgi:dTDP-4-amino-4,6-dideoxygalactose transaminase
MGDRRVDRVRGGPGEHRGRGRVRVDGERGGNVVTRLAVLGGEPAFPAGIPFVRPPTPPLDRVVARLAPSYDRGALTDGPLVRELEERTAERLGVRHVVAVASCTAGLMLTLRALELTGPVVVPSFTFSATAHAVTWNGLVPVFSECDPHSFQLDCSDASARLDGAGAVIATHVFGAPCEPERVEELAATVGVPLIFDAAHAFGAERAGRAVGGYGWAEVFSLSPTKPLIAGEGGLVATDRDDLAAAVRMGRNYGNPGDYDTQFAGLNARMSELHAALALESLTEVDQHLATRRRLADGYTTSIEPIPGLAVQQVDPEDRSTWKDYTIAVDADRFGIARDALVTALRAEGVDTRCYFDPPVHRQASYATARVASLPVTDRASSRVVSLPLYRDLGDAVVDRVSELLAQIHADAEAVSAAV